MSALDHLRTLALTMSFWLVTTGLLAVVLLVRCTGLAGTLSEWRHRRAARRRAAVFDPVRRGPALLTPARRNILPFAPLRRPTWKERRP